MAREVKSPIPGTFYRKPAPDRPPFKSEGDAVVVGDTIGLIEVMKTFHEVKADIAGTVHRFEVEDADPVMAGQVLMLLN